MQSSSRRGFVCEGEFQPNPNSSSAGKNRGLQGAVRRAQPPASVWGRLRAGLATRCGHAADRPHALGRPMQTPIGGNSERRPAVPSGEGCPGSCLHLPSCRPCSLHSPLSSAPSAGVGATGDQVPAGALTGEQPAKPPIHTWVRWACGGRPCPARPEAPGQLSATPAPACPRRFCLPGDGGLPRLWAFFFFS